MSSPAEEAKPEEAEKVVEKKEEVPEPVIEKKEEIIEPVVVEVKIDMTEEVVEAKVEAKAPVPVKRSLPEPTQGTPQEKAKERTFIMIKYDGTQRGKIGDTVKRFEKRGFKLVGFKMCQPPISHWKQHYIELAHLDFYEGYCASMAAGPVVAMCWEGTDVVR